MADLGKQLEPVVLVNTKNFVATHIVCHDILFFMSNHAGQGREAVFVL